LPYIQLHELEGLLFSDISGFEQLPYLNPKSLEKIKAIIDMHTNPELINDGETTHPSARLEKLLPDYKKPIRVLTISKNPGIEKILNKCPHFKNWIEKIIKTVKEN
jgi:hypothetical protein